MIYCIIILALIAAAVTCQAVWYRRKWKEENSRRWQETSIMLSVEKEKDAEIETLQEWNRAFEKRGDFWFDTAEKVTLERDALQDRLSAALCPSNNHVWKDGVCTKCGMIQE